MNISILRVFVVGICFLIFSPNSHTQTTPEVSRNLVQKQHRIGQWYVYWGWNGSKYTKSDIHFEGTDHNFVLRDVVANDRQTEFTLKKYFHPAYFTTPQYNFRVGKYLKNNWDVSMGIDHMKYVVRQGQTVNIDGSIQIQSSEHSGTYSNAPVEIEKGFLEYEHTDGLNYINISVRKNLQLTKGKFGLDFFYGSGLGVLIPKSDVTLVNLARHDALHLSGYGVDVNLGFRLTFRDRLFIQSELKSGIINLPGVRTTQLKSSGANQNFGFVQHNVVFGGNMFLKNKNSEE